MSKFLEKIEILNRDRVRLAKERVSEIDLLKVVDQARQPHDFLSRFSASTGTRIIAEVKRRSPSLENIALDLDPIDVAIQYYEAGAAAISVLTEPQFFGGDLVDLANIRRRLPEALLLRKDFMNNSYQLLEARAYGADAVLLIHKFLGAKLLRELYGFASELGLTPLVEVHDRAEFADAVAMQARFIGVNNRDLTILKTSLDTSRTIANCDRGDATLISESGIEDENDIRELTGLGFSGFLIGTSLMRDRKPHEDLKELLRKCS